MSDTTQNARFVVPLVRTLDWTLTLERAPGELICPEHKVEHTGKSANVVILAAELFRATGETRFREIAKRIALRVASRLEREGTSPCFTFRPGRHDPFNCSNSVIDGGAASDALATLALSPREFDLSADERHTLALAALRHAMSYLRFAAVDKGIPAQRAWALTGLAASLPLALEPELVAAAFEPFDGQTPAADWHAVMLKACEDALGVLGAIQHADGSFPYHPHSWSPGHPGAADASSFYQSRVTGFCWHALETMGRAPLASDHGAHLLSGVEFLAGLYGPDGLKAGLVEAKPWYWGATYEVASHVFDVHVLAKAAARVGKKSGEIRSCVTASESAALQNGERAANAAIETSADTLAILAQMAFDQWAAHLLPSGAPASHKPGHGRCPSYQCELFWASHAAWAARALGDLAALSDVAVPKEVDLPSAVFADAQLARLSAPGLAAFVRGARPPGNVNHGSVHGAGVIRLIAGRTEVLPRCRFGGSQLGEWTGKVGGWRWRSAWTGGKEELRFSLWTARVHWRAGRKLDALLDAPRVFRRAIVAFAYPRVSSAFARDVELDVQLDLEPGQVPAISTDNRPHIAPVSARHLATVTGALAWRDGAAVPGVTMRRRFALLPATEIRGAAIQVTDELLCAGWRENDLRELDYRLPVEAQILEDSGRGTPHARVVWEISAP